MVDFGDPRFRALSALHIAVGRCTACPLHHWATSPVPNEGTYHKRIVVLGEAPGEDEDKAGRPFVGRSGKLLRSAILTAGVTTWCYIANVVHCRPPKEPGNPKGGVRQPSPREIDTCWPLHTAKELEIIKPAVIVVLGETAALALLKPEKPTTISSLRRDPSLRYEATNSRVLAEYHPAYILRQGSPHELVQHLILTFKRAARIVEKTPVPPNG